MPQCSILGPLFFLVFINDLPDYCVNLKTLLNVDNAKFISSGQAQGQIQRDLNNVFNWTIDNNMPFNLDKCTYLKLGKNTNDSYFNGHKINKIDVQKDPVLTISSDLNWNIHIDNACKKANRVFFMIKRNTNNLSRTAKLNLYKSMVVPVLTYANPCYGLSKYVTNELETIQKRVVKWIFPGTLAYNEKIAQLQILPLPMYIQINNNLLLSKIGFGRYDDKHVNVPILTESSRGVMFQLKRPKCLKAEQNFFYQTCRLVKTLKIDVRADCGLKQLLLRKFWLKFGEYNEVDKCTWKIGCDCAANNCRSKTYI